MKEEFVQRMGKICKQWGLGEPAGKVWAILMLNKDCLTQKEIARQCRYSLGLVSPSIKILESLGMITNIGKKGKEKIYRVTVSAMDFFGRLICNFMEQDIRPMLSLLESNIRQIEDQGVKARVKQLIRDYEGIKRIVSELADTLTKNNMTLAGI